MKKAFSHTHVLSILLGVTMATTSLAAYENQDKSKKPSMSFMETLSVMKEVFFGGGRRSPVGKLPEVKPDMTAFQAPSDKLKFIWLGHSTLLLNLEGQNVLIDPVFFNASPVSFMIKRFQPPVIKLEELPPIQTIVISHDHYDHLDRKTIQYFIEKPVNFLVPTGVGEHLRSWGVNPHRITELKWHESITRQGITYRATPAQHFSGRGLFDRNETLWASWIIKTEHENIYYSGDSGYGPHFKEIGKLHGPFDYAFLENGQYNERWPDVHMQPEETLQALLDLNAQTLIPVHWGMFDLSLHHWSEPIIRTHTIAKNWDIPILTPRLGEIVDSKNHPSSPWWEGVTEVAPTQRTPIYIRELATK